MKWQKIPCVRFTSASGSLREEAGSHCPSDIPRSHRMACSRLLTLREGDVAAPGIPCVRFALRRGRGPSPPPEGREMCCLLFGLVVLVVRV